MWILLNLRGNKLDGSLDVWGFDEGHFLDNFCVCWRFVMNSWTGPCRSSEDTWALRPANLVSALNVSRLKTRSVGRGLGSCMKTFYQKWWNIFFSKDLCTILKWNLHVSCIKKKIKISIINYKTLRTCILCFITVCPFDLLRCAKDNVNILFFYILF